MAAGHAGRPTFKVDSPDLYRLKKQLDGVDKKLSRELKQNLTRAADPIVRRVKSEASFSKRIPGAVGVNTRFTAKTTSISIVVNRKKAPHARPLENDGKPGFFTHPVPIRASGTRRGRLRQAVRGNTVKQKARPFFTPAIKSGDHNIDQAVLDAVKAIERKAGFR